MKGDSGLVSRTRADFVAVVSTMLAAVVCTFVFFSSHQVIWDIGWLIEASRRWLQGAVLYRDIVEVNPPLIFYETVALSGGWLTQTAYIGGVCVAILVSGLWVLRLGGPYVALSATAAMIIAGTHDFGQRDHLALIFGLPFVLRPRVSRSEGVGLGIWSFLGFGLKPYLLLIPAFEGVARARLSRSIRVFCSAPYITLVALCCAYLAGARILHPLYFTRMIPLGRFVYWAYDTPLTFDLAILSAVIILTSAAELLSKQREFAPLAAASLASLGSFYIQGRYWTYHFVPALGFCLTLALIEARGTRLFAALATLLIVGQLMRGVSPRVETPIPAGTHSVAILSSQVGAAYPTVLERGIVNDTRYPALWVLPGAWSIANDPKRTLSDRARARTVLSEERRIIRRDILAEEPELILVDEAHNKAHFDRPFDYMNFLGPLPSYTLIGKRGVYAVYQRSDKMRSSAFQTSS